MHENDDAFAAGPKDLLEGVQAYTDIAAERIAQDAEHGGPDHDDTHTLVEWQGFISERLPALEGGHSEVREALVEIAALAVAAIESIDRKEGREVSVS